MSISNMQIKTLTIRVSVSILFWPARARKFQERCPSWSKEHAWRACSPLKGLLGSNPSLSVIVLGTQVDDNQSVLHVIQQPFRVWSGCNIISQFSEWPGGMRF